jgi:hypothetical protein
MIQCLIWSAPEPLPQPQLISVRHQDLIVVARISFPGQLAEQNGQTVTYSMNSKIVLTHPDIWVDRNYISVALTASTNLRTDKSSLLRIACTQPICPDHAKGQKAHFLPEVPSMQA